jgi:hypothetical protein
MSSSHVMSVNIRTFRALEFRHNVGLAEYLNVRALHEGLSKNEELMSGIA